MEYVRLGTTGTKVSRICLGCMSFGTDADWKIGEADSFAMIEQALASGINFFDTADMYALGESEQILGKALKQFNVRREDVVIATKLFFPLRDGANERGLSRKKVMAAIDESLSRLGVDYVDLYQIHRFDYETPMEETLEALTDLIRVGKVRHIGASSMYGWQFAKYLYLADRHGFARFATMQNLYNLCYREEEREVIPLCEAEGVGLIPWSPLAGGYLAGSHERNTVRSQLPGSRERYSALTADQEIYAQAKAIAAKRGVEPAQVAIAWLLSKPAMTAPIIGASKASHLDAPVKAVGLKLEPGEIAALEAPYKAREVIGALRAR